MASDPNLTSGNRVCRTFGRDPAVLTVEQLYKALLHLATFKEWSTDLTTGVLSAGGGYFGKDKNINIYAFTNKEADPGQTKVYTNLYPLSEDLDKMYDDWYARRNPGKKPDKSYIETAYPDFLNNPASIYKIEKWKLKWIQKIRLTSGDASREDVKAEVDLKVAPVRYALRFVGPGGYELTLNFYPNDKIYFCKYETKGEVETKRTGPLAAGAPAEYMGFYEMGPLKLADVPCSLEGKSSLTRKEETVNDVVNFVKAEEKKRGNPWRKFAENGWRVDNIKNGIHLNYIFGYKAGVPVLAPKLGPDNAGLRLIEVVDVGDNLWKLKLAQENRAGYLTVPKIDLYVTGDDKVSRCL